MDSSDQSDFVRYGAMLRRRWLPASLIFILVLTLVSLKAFREKSIYRAQGQLLFERTQDTSIGLDLDSKEDEFKDKNFLATKILALSSKALLDKVETNLKSSFPESYENELSDNLTVTPVGETNVVQVAYVSLNPQIAEFVVNQLLELHVEDNLRSNRAKVSSAHQFIDQQLPKVKQRVFTAESTLRRFKESHQIADLSIAIVGNAQNQARLKQELEAADRKVEDLKAQHSSLQGLLNVNVPIAASALNQNQSLARQKLDELERQSLARKKLDELEQEWLEKSATLGPANPDRIELKEKIDKQRAALKANNEQQLNQPKSISSTQADLYKQLVSLEVNLKGALEERTRLNVAYDNSRKQAVDLPRLEQRQKELEREIEASKSILESLLQRLQEIKVIENQILPTVRIIERAELPDYPSGPNRASTLIRGGLLGFLLAASIVFLLENLDRKLKSVDDIRDVYPYPILGEIPLFDNRKSSLIKMSNLHNDSSYICEAYRHLQANMKFLKSEMPFKVITVTSAIPSEGKSTTCAELATVLTQMGQRVLLIDADMRTPSQHEIWEIEHQGGLAHTLAKSSQGDEVALSTQTVHGVEVLTTIPAANPLKLLDSKLMASLISDQAQYYNYILIDTPPIRSVVDALVVNQVADGILLVARPGKLDRGSARKVLNALLQSESTVLGVVANGVSSKDVLSYNYSYGGANTLQEHNTEEAITGLITKSSKA